MANIILCQTDEVGSKLREDPEYTASLIKMNCEIRIIMLWIKKRYCKFCKNIN